MNTQKQIGLIVVLLFMLVGGCTAYSSWDLPHRAVVQANYQHDQSVERGALLFANNCRTCHGIRGQGGVGLPLNKPAFQNQDPLVLAANRALLQTTLYCGRAGTLMPPWLNTNGGSLNSEQIVHLIDLITEPVDPTGKSVDDTGAKTSKGWAEAIFYAHNLNRESTALVGGDTLDTVATAHRIGYSALASLNNLPIEGVLKQGSVLHMPPFKLMPNGYDYHVYNNNETIIKVADSQHVGGIILADLNNIPYHFTEVRGTATFTVLDDKGNEVPGLFPGTNIALPAGAEYVISAGDTLQSIATQANITPDQITALNPGLAPKDPKAPLTPTTELNSKRQLTLPPGTGAVVQPAQTLGVIADDHGITVAELEQANGITAAQAASVKPGTTLKLPAGVTYTIQAGDTLAKVATEHGISEATLASANNLKPGDYISPSVIIKLPKIDKFTIHGQTLAEVAKGFSNVTAAGLATANNLPGPDVILRVGQALSLPADAWGPPPGTTINNGTACVEHAVPHSTFVTLPGIGTPPPTATAPATVSKVVTIDAHANDYTVTADGAAQKPNEGVVSIAAGTSIKFTNIQGLHTITENGVQQGPNFTQGQVRTLTFATPGAYKITCDFHPAMLANIFVK